MEAHRDDKTGRWTLTGVEPSEQTFDRICNMLRGGADFKFARYGDGEFFAMAGKVGKNCDGHQYFPEMGMALCDAFYSDPDYMVGIQPLSVSGGQYQRAISVRPGPTNIYDADVLHSASIDGKLGIFLDCLDLSSTVIVGPYHLSDFQLNGKLYFKDCYHIVIPSLNCWNSYHEIKSLMNDAIENCNTFLLCASMMSEVLINDFKDNNCTMIDCGSVFDVYANKPSRSYHYKMTI